MLPDWMTPPSERRARMEPTETLDARSLLSRLRKVRKSGAGWVACCPAHDDAEPSLSVSEGEGGRVLLNCHRGCTFDAIVSALDVPAASLMGDAPAGDGATREAAPAVRPPAEDYDYEDAGGRVVFRVTRYYRKSGDGWAKSFVQKRATGDGFENGMRGVERVPYNLPAVLAAPGAGQPVYVVEGEKDVHTLRDWGLVATCNPGGAGKWDPAFGRYLAGADVVVLPDNDDAGRAHAADVAEGARPHAASVVVVDLPGLPPKGDVTDWRRLGHTRDELAGLAARVRDSAPLMDEDADLGPIRRPLVDLPGIDPDAVRALPQLLRELGGHYPAGPERDVAITSALAVLSGAMPNARVAHYDKDYGLHLMFCLVARSGGGKGVLDQVARLTSLVDKSVRDDAKWKLERWEHDRATLKGAERVDLGPAPFPTAYLIPANASKSYVLRSIAEAGETACMVETEIDTLVGASEQEWGDFSDLIRKAFHHEDYRMGRVGAGNGETTVIERPSLALAISGTWGQFERLYGQNVENGFFNRFLFYVSNAAPRWRSPRPTDQSWRREAWYADAARAVLDVFDVLKHRAAPLRITLSPAAWDRLDALYGAAYEEAVGSPERDSALPFVQRSALMAVRLAGVLTVLRAYEHNVDLNTGSLQVTDYDAALALHIAQVWYAHGAALLTHLNGATNRTSPLVSLTDEARAVYDALPETFKRADANAVGEAEGVSARTVKRYLQQYQEAGTVVRDGHTYTKVSAPAVEPFTPPEA